MKITIKLPFPIQINIGKKIIKSKRRYYLIHYDWWDYAINNNFTILQKKQINTNQVKQIVKKLIEERLRAISKKQGQKYRTLMGIKKK